MRIIVDVSSEIGRLALGRPSVRALADQALRAEGVREALLSIAFVRNSTIARLNERHLHHRGPTDIISFGFAPLPHGEKNSPVVGDIYIAPQVAAANARHHGVGVRDELARLVVHGVLHVLGHEHPIVGAREQSPMWRRQEALLARAGYGG